MKSVDLVRANAEKDRQKRTSPSRYTKIKSKITNQVHLEGQFTITMSQTQLQKTQERSSLKHDKSMDNIHKSPDRKTTMSPNKHLSSLRRSKMASSFTSLPTDGTAIIHVDD